MYSLSSPSPIWTTFDTLRSLFVTYRRSRFLLSSSLLSNTRFAMYSSLPVPFGSNATVAMRLALPTSVELLHRNVDISLPLPSLSLAAPSYVVWNSLDSTPDTTSSWFWNSGTHPSVPYGLLRSVVSSFMPVTSSVGRPKPSFAAVVVSAAAACGSTICGSRPASILHINSKLQIRFFIFLPPCLMK